MWGRTPVETKVAGSAGIMVCRQVAKYRRVIEADARKAVEYVAYALGVTDTELLDRAVARIWRDYRETYATRDRLTEWVKAQRAKETATLAE